MVEQVLNISTKVEESYGANLSRKNNLIYNQPYYLLEVGQISAFIRDIKPAGEIVKDVWKEFLEAKRKLCEHGI